MIIYIKYGKGETDMLIDFINSIIGCSTATDIYYEGYDGFDRGMLCKKK